MKQGSKRLYQSLIKIIMSCCNQKRASLAQPASLNVNNNIQQVSIQYTGMTALSATGIATGRKYFFSKPGDIQNVDYRDVTGMLNVPVLKRI